MSDDRTKIADLRAMLAVKRRLLEEQRLGQIDLPVHELHDLQHALREDEQALRDLGVDDA